jgi:hypothetical protein
LSCFLFSSCSFFFFSLFLVVAGRFINSPPFELQLGNAYKTSRIVPLSLLRENFLVLRSASLCITEPRRSGVYIYSHFQNNICKTLVVGNTCPPSTFRRGGIK